MSMSKAERAHWNRPPVRIGAIYCSPWCGCECRWTAYERANENAAAMCKYLGPGWTPRVWENFGWHYSAVKGRMEIMPRTPGEYKSAGSPRWTPRIGGTIYFNAPRNQFLERYARSPKAAIKRALAAARALTSELLEAVREVES